LAQQIQAMGQQMQDMQRRLDEKGRELAIKEGDFAER